MDPSAPFPPPPIVDSAAPATIAAVDAFAALATPANPAPASHPPYAEMICAAIAALEERDGSSKIAIAKFIDEAYSGLPQTHSALLATHLKRLKNSGAVVMVKKSGAVVMVSALSNGIYKSCVHGAVVNNRRERRSLAFLLCPKEDKVLRPPQDVVFGQRKYPEFTWSHLLSFTQHHYRADADTLQNFITWFLSSNPNNNN